MQLKQKPSDAILTCRMVRRYSVSPWVVLLVLWSFCYPATWLLGDGATTLELESCDLVTTKLYLRCGELSARSVQTPYGAFAELSMPGADPSAEVGAPKLPVVRVWVEVPQGGKPTAEFIPGDVTTVALSAFGLPSAVYPRQPPAPKVPGYTPQFTLNAARYITDRFAFDEPAVVIDVVQARNHRLALVEVRPVNYNPVTGVLAVAEDGTLLVETPTPDLAATESLTRRHKSPLYDAVLRRIVVNAGAFEALWVVPTEIEMIIVTDASFSSQLDPLVRWRWRKGFEVDLKTASELGGTADAIKNYIQSRYESDDVDFVLLVGDVAQVPTFTGGESGSSSDNPYSELAGADFVPDCFVGRLSLTSATQVAEMVQRILDYEHLSFGSGAEWTEGTCLPASDDASYHTLAENTQRYVAYNHFIPQGYTRVDTIWAYYGGTGADVINSVNAGVMTLIYTGHGYNAGWAGPEVDQDDVRNLANQGKYPMVLSFACQTGMFGEYNECFMETWIRQTDKGAIASMGASDYTYWYEDDVFERRMIDSVFVSGWCFTSGMRLKGLMAVYASYPSSAEYYFDVYNLLGDPSVALWWGEPQDMVVSHPEVVPPGEGEVSVSVSCGGTPLPEALVCITNDSTIHQAAYTDASGSVTLPYSGAAPGETLWVTATAYNKLPYEDYIVVAGSGPFLVYQSHTVQDNGGSGSLGDGDGTADAGERLALWVTLRNAGSEPAYGVSAAISTTSPYVSVVDDESYYGNILAGTSGSPSDPFVVQLLGMPPDSTTASFVITATDAPGSTWTDEFSLLLRAPMLRVEGNSWLDADGDGFAEPGEWVELSVTVGNAGGDDAESVAGTVSEDDPYVTITLDSVFFGDISAGGAATSAPNYRLSISPSCPTPRLVKIYHTASEGRGYSFVDTLSLVVGTCGFYDDAESGLDLWSAGEYWHTTTYRHNSGTHAFYVGDEEWAAPFQYHDTLNTSLTTLTPVTLPDAPTLSFWHYYEVEYGYDSCFVEVSSDGGASWSTLGSYTGPSFGWRFAAFDLSPFGDAGDEVLLRFRFYSDGGVHNHGWFIDDVSVAPQAQGYVGAGDVFPKAGAPGDTFTYRITYASPNGYVPTGAIVYIDGIPHDMTGAFGSISTGRVFEHRAALGEGAHTFRFAVAIGPDTLRFPESGALWGPVVAEPTYDFDLGTSDGGFTTQSFSYYQDWQWGAPSFGPPGVPYGTSCWGTQLASTYHDSSQSRLMSPTFEIPDDAYLVIWHWYRAQPSDIPRKHDGGNVKLSVGGSQPFVIFPQGGYDGHASMYNQFVRRQPIFGDTLEARWQEESFDLTPWAGQSAQVIFDFGSSSRNTEAGWYINRVMIISAVAAEARQKPPVPERIRISAAPNPFNDRCAIAVELPDGCTEAQLKIFDIRGRCVAAFHLSTGRNEVVWDASSAPSGIYCAKVLNQTKRLLHVK